MNYREAHANGSKTFTGKPCRKFGHTERLVRSPNTCLACLQIRQAQPHTKTARRISQKKYNKTPKGQNSLKTAFKKYRVKNREKSRLRDNERLKTDLVFKIKKYLRPRLRSAIKNNYKKGSAVQDLGCSVEFFKEYIGNQFQSGMTWDNWGEWHLDHKRPLSSFDLSIREQFLQAVHFTNYQPLWAVDNLRKGSKCESI
jgi:hypothetical protein